MKKLILLLVLFAGLEISAIADTFYEYHTIYCGAILELGPVGYVVWNPATVIKAPLPGQAFIFTDSPFPDSLVYKSDYGYLGQDTFVVACAHANQITCDTGIYIISVAGCPPIQSFTEAHEIACDSTLLIPGLGFPTWVTPEIIQPPAHGTASLSLDSTLWHTLQYLPEADFNGIDTIVVECAHATQITCETGIFIIQVSCLNSVGEVRLGKDCLVYPNPATSFIVIESGEAIEEARIYSLNGRVLWEKQWSEGTFVEKLSVDGLSPGIYLLEIWVSGKRSMRLIAK
ncbi:MAG: T9SS type A sorting domain-containing protein [Saprospirales bacterium]|nr:T9SS type A sorting domain-containing protein [Saprospirales bacterium]